MTELEKIEQLEKQLKARKRKALAKEYEKLGKRFLKQSNAKNIESANQILDKNNLNTDVISTEEYITKEQFLELLNIANNMQWNGNFWKIGNITDVSQWLSQFRTKK